MSTDIDKISLAQVYNWVRLKFAAMNLKKLARWKTTKRFAPASSAASYILSLINFVACLVMKPDRPFFRQTEAHADACAFLCPQTVEGGTIMESSIYLGREMPGKLPLKFAVPCIFSPIISYLYSIVDQIFVDNGMGYLSNELLPVK